MAYFAVLNGDVVSNVIVSDSLENAKLTTNLTCVEYNDNNPAGIGWTYDGIGFISPQPFASWVLNKTTYRWEAPTPKPTEEGKFFTWDESTLSWVKV